MNVLTSDWEVTTSNKGNPFDLTNKAVCLGFKLKDEPSVCEFDLDAIPANFLTDTLCVFFNAKFDLHWYRRLGFELPTNVWCCQLAEFILERQSNAYPSLEKTAIKYELGNKIDVIKTDYWDKGIDTDAIPVDVLSDYCKQDVDLTYAIYLKQQEQFIQKPGLYRLFKLACKDLLILEEMEYNGLKFDPQLCQSRIEQCDKEMQVHLDCLNAVYPGVPINFNSSQQLSAFLYGGTIVEAGKAPDGFFKSGVKKGQIKYKNIEIEHPLPRMVEPLPKTKMAKENIFATNEPTLKKLKGPFAKKYVPHLLALAKLDKLKGTYYKGIPKLNVEMNWEDNMIFPQYNQCVAQTGRLSSSQPNAQNISGDVADIIISRYLD